MKSAARILGVVVVLAVSSSLVMAQGKGKGGGRNKVKDAASQKVSENRLPPAAPISDIIPKADDAVTGKRSMPGTNMTDRVSCGNGEGKRNRKRGGGNGAGSGGKKGGKGGGRGKQ
jgi:hypothetical protein